MVLAESRNESVEATIQQSRGRPRHPDAIDPDELVAGRSGSGGVAAATAAAAEDGSEESEDDSGESSEDRDRSPNQPRRTPYGRDAYRLRLLCCLC